MKTHKLYDPIYILKTTQRRQIYGVIKEVSGCLGLRKRKGV
jgi:hypothetical protein